MPLSILRSQIVRSSGQLLERLEDRVLFDAAPDSAVQLSDPDTNVAQSQTANEVSTTGGEFREDGSNVAIALVDVKLADSDRILKSLLDENPHLAFQVHYLQDISNGEQLVDALNSLQAKAPGTISSTVFLLASSELLEGLKGDANPSVTLYDDEEGASGETQSIEVTLNTSENVSVRVVQHARTADLQSQIAPGSHNADKEDRTIDLQGRELIVVDSRLKDLENLVTSLSSNTNAHVVVINSDSDGILELEKLLGIQHGLKAIHILSHGSTGELDLGTAKVTQESMKDVYKDALRTIGASLEEGGDIFIYGCEFARGAGGLEALELLAKLTGADIAASNDATGHESWQGNWELEIHSGTIEMAGIRLTHWESLLAPPVVIIPPNQETLEDVSIVFDSTKLISVGSNESTQLTITLTADHGILLLSSTAGLNFLDSTLNGQSVVKFQGTIANLNNALSNLRLDLQSNYFGHSKITIIASDGLVETSRELGVNVISQNDAPNLVVNPVNADNSGSLIEGGSYVFTASDIHAVDPDNSENQLVYVLTALPDVGFLRLNGHAVAVGTIFTQAQLNAGRLTYHHDGSENHFTAFSVSVNDGAGGSQGPVQVPLHITMVNSPMSVDVQAVVYEGGSTNDPAPGPGKPVPALSITVTDPEADAKEVVIETLPEGGVLKYDGVVITQSDIDIGFVIPLALTNLLEYKHNGIDVSGDSDRTFRIVVRDVAGTLPVAESRSVNVNINVIDVNDDLELVHHDNSIKDILATSAYTLSLADMEVHDPDGPDGNITYTLMNMPNIGILTVNGSPVAAGATFTQAQLAAGLVVFQHGSTTGGLDQLRFTARDSAVSIVTDELGTLRVNGPTSPARQLDLNFNVIKDISEGFDLSIEVVEGQSVVFDDFEVGDVITFDSLPVDGTIFYNGVAVTLGQTITVANGSTFSFTHNGMHRNGGPFSLTYNGEQEVGEILVFLVNDAPQLSILQPLTTVYEGQSHVINGSYLLGTDEETPQPSELIYTITKYPANGVVLVNGVEQPSFSSFSHQDVLDGKVSYRHNGGEQFLDSIVLSLSDGSRVDTKTLQIQALPVNDRPHVNESSLLVREGETKAFSSANLSVGDVDGVGADIPLPSDSPLTISIATLPSHGTLTYNHPINGLMVLNASNIVGLVIDAQNVNRLSYQHDSTENFDDSFEFVVNDNHLNTTPHDAPGTTVGTMVIEIIPVNDPPEVSQNIGLVQDAESDRRVYEGAIGVFDSTILNSADPDSTDEQLQYRLTISPANGQLLLNGSPIGVGSAFTQIDLQNGRVSYRHNGSETLTDSFVFRVDDSASNVSPTTVHIGIIPVNDAPTISARSAVTVDSNNFSFVGPNRISIADVDANGGVLRTTLKLSQSDATLNINPSGLSSITGNGTDELIIEGTVAQINAALLTLHFSSSDLDSQRTLSITVSDLGNSGTDPHDVPAGLIPGLVDTGTATDEIATHLIILSVSTINDQPTVDHLANVTSYEGVRYTFSQTNANAITISDSDHFGANIEVSISATHNARLTLASTTGITILSGQASNSTAITMLGRLEDINNAINGLIYDSNGDFNGLAEVIITVNDRGNTGAGGNNVTQSTVTVSVTPTNDRPTVVAPTGMHVINGLTSIPGISINDPDYSDGTNPAATPNESDFLQVLVRISNSFSAPIAQSAYAGLTFSSANSFGVTIDGTENGDQRALLIRGTRAQVNGYLSGLQIQLNAPFLNNDGAFRIEIIVDDRLRLADGALDTSRMANGGFNIVGTTGVTEVPTTAIPVYGAFPSTLTQNTNRAFVDFISTSSNESPGFSNLSPTVTFTEGTELANGAPVRIATGASLTDPELVALNNWANTSLTVARQGGSLTEDNFVILTGGSPLVTTSGASISVANRQVASFSTSGGSLTVTFLSNAVTSAEANAVLRAIAYQNTNHYPPSSVVLDITVNDGDLDPDRTVNPQGSGGAKSNTQHVTVNIVSVNDTPVLSGISTVSYVEDSPSIILAAAGIALDRELQVHQSGAGDWGNATLNVQRQGGANASDLFSYQGLVGTLTGGTVLTLGGENVATVQVNSSGRLFILFHNGATTSDVESVIRSIQYSNSDPTGSRGTIRPLFLQWTLNDGDVDPDSAINPQGTTGAKQTTIIQEVRMVGRNDEPSGQDNRILVNQDTTYTLREQDFGFHELVESPSDNFLNLIVSTLPAQGVLNLNGSPVTAGQSVSVADIRNGLLTWTPAALQGGPDYALFTFQVQDDGGTSNGGLNTDQTPNTVIFDVNMAPKLDFNLNGNLPDRENQDSQTIALPLSPHFFDPENHSYTLAVSGLPPGLTFDPALNEISGPIDSSASVLGPYNVVVQATDSLGATQRYEFIWRVTNPSPNAVADHYTTNENTSFSGNVLQNDSDPDNDTFNVSQVGGSASNLGVATAGSQGGTFIISADGSFQFSPGTSFDALNPDQSITTSISYQIIDKDGATATATVEVIVTGLNDVPTASVIPSRTNVDGDTILATTNVNVATFFTDVDNQDILTYSDNGTLPSGLSINSATGAITGTIHSSASVQVANGVYTVSITATDKHNASVTQTFQWTITNPAPVAADDTNTTNQLTSIVGNVLFNDSDPDHDSLIVSYVHTTPTSSIPPANSITVSGSSGGLFTINRNGAYTFDPNNEFNYLNVNQSETTTVEYTMTDEQGGTSIATLTVTVTGTNDAPVLSVPNFDFFDYEEVDIDLSDYVSDIDTNSTVAEYLLTGTLPGNLQFLPDEGRIVGRLTSNASQISNGSYSLELTVIDEHGGTVKQNFVIRVSNIAPVASDDAITTDELTSVLSNVLTNDSDTDLDSFSLLEVAGESAFAGIEFSGSHGGVFTFNADGSFTFDPGDDFVGLAEGEFEETSISYRITDGQNGFSSATVTVRVNGLNTTPTVTPAEDRSNKDSETVSLDFSTYFGEVDNGDALKFSLDSDLPLGLTLDPTTGVVSGTLDSSASQGGNNGVYEVTVVATDELGASISIAFTWTITNPEPVSLDDSTSTNEASTVSGDVLTNDSDEDGDDIFVSAVQGNSGSVGQPIRGDNGGYFTIQANGDYQFDTQGEFEYLAAGEEKFTRVVYTTSDADGGTSSATLTVRVTGLNDTPVTAGIPSQTGEDSAPALLDVSTYFQDPDGADQLLYSFTTPLPPGLTLDPTTGVISGVIGSSASVDGPYTITIRATDPHGEYIESTFTWTITNPPPVASDDRYEVSGNDLNNVVGNVLNNDSDPDSDALEAVPVTSIAGSHGGLFTIAPDGTISFDPNGDFDHVHVTDSLTTTLQYTLIDADGATATATISITVLGINHSPVAINDIYEVAGGTIFGNALTNDSDPDGHPVSGEISNPPSHGTLVWNIDGSFSYTPGPSFIDADQFTYTITDIYGATSTATVYITRPFAWDSFRNESNPPQHRWIANHGIEQLVSHQLNLMGANPIVAGYATPGAILKGRIYDVSGGVIAEVTTQANAAGNWVMNFPIAKQLHNPIVIIEHIASEEVKLGNLHHFRLTDNTYRSLQLGVEHHDALSIGSILSDRPSLVLQRMHKQNMYPLVLR